MQIRTGRRDRTDDLRKVVPTRSVRPQPGLQCWAVTMTATTPSPAVPALGAVGPERRPSLLRTDTPGRMRVCSIAVAVVTVIFGIVGSTAIANRATDLGDARDAAAQLERLESVRTAVVEADSLAASAYLEDYELFPAPVYAAYGKLQEFARDLNTSIAAPEIVLVGKVGSGKSTVLDGIIGERVNPPRETKRPLHLTLVNNAECVEPRITIKRDATIPE